MTVDHLIELLQEARQTCDGELPVRIGMLLTGDEHDLDEGISVFEDQVLFYERGYAVRWRTEVTNFTTPEELERIAKEEKPRYD